MKWVLLNDEGPHKVPVTEYCCSNCQSLKSRPTNSTHPLRHTCFLPHELTIKLSWENEKVTNITLHLKVLFQTHKHVVTSLSQNNWWSTPDPCFTIEVTKLVGYFILLCRHGDFIHLNDFCHYTSAHGQSACECQGFLWWLFHVGICCHGNY